jgi:long-chain acyl-CoA synthetase
VPAPLEEQLKLSGFIANVMVFGANKPFNVGIVVPDWAALEAWAKEQGLSAERGDLVRDARVNELLNGEIERFSSGVFKGFEKLRAFRPIVEDFTVDNDMLTPSMKVKRRNVIAAYQVLIDEMYASTPDKGE